MADSIVSALTVKTTPVGADILYLVDSQNTTQNAAGSSACLTLGNLSSNFLQSSVQTLTNKTFDTAGTGNVFKINGTTISAITGTGSAVLATSPTLVTPTIGVATATSINKVTITAPASSATLTIANSKTFTASNSITIAGTDGKTLTVSNSLTLAGTDSTTMTFPGTSDTVVTLSATQTLTNKRRTRRLVTTTQSATPTINTDNGDVFNITGLAQAITSMTTNLSGTPNDGDLIEIRITDSGSARTITWGTSFESTTVALPTTTVTSVMLRIGLEWNATASKWDCIAVA